jgi:NitT/TauT family transport system substrate-binding protein
MSRKSLYISAILCAFLACAILGCKRPERQEKLTIVVVSQTAFTSFPITMAQQLGYYRDENLDVTIVDVNGPSRAIEALSGHSADIGAAILDNVVLATSEGKPFRAFVLMSDSPELALALSPKSKDIHNLNDLRGHSIGIPTLGSSSETFVRYLCFRNGIDQSSLHFIALGSPQARIASLENGQIDAAVISDPAIAYLSAKYGATFRLLADTRTPAGVQQSMGLAAYPGTVVFASPEWLAKNPDAARKVARAVVRAQQYLRAHSPQEVEKILPPSFNQPDEASFATGLRASAAMYSSDGRFDPQTVKVVSDVLSVFFPQVRSKHADLGGIVTNEYLPQ